MIQSSVQKPTPACRRHWPRHDTGTTQPGSPARERLGFEQGAASRNKTDPVRPCELFLQNIDRLALSALSGTARQWVRRNRAIHQLRSIAFQLFPGGAVLCSKSAIHSIKLEARFAQCLATNIGT